MNKFALLLFLSICIFACKSDSNKNISNSSNSLEWTYLCDGESTEGWRSYNGTALPSEWVVVNGELTFDKTKKNLEVEHEGGKDIIYATEEFDNFELYVEWKIPAGGNSGILYHIKEGYGGPSEIAPEYQLIDDEGYEGIHDYKLADWQKTGADYAMHTGDESKKVLNPAGSWNSSKIVFTEDKVEHWLNDQLLFSFVPWTDEWNKKRMEGKWKDFPDYGKFRSGYIGLQDHDSPLWFREIKIKKL